MATKKTQKPELEIVNSITDTTALPGTKEHAVMTLFKGGVEETLPLITSVGCVKIPGSRNYASYVITSQGSKILKVEVEEPNLKQIAEDCAKINFVNLFLSPEL